MREETTYIAEDGTRFTDENACFAHERKCEAKEDLLHLLAMNKYSIETLHPLADHLIEHTDFGGRFYDILRKVYGY